MMLLTSSLVLFTKFTCVNFLDGKSARLITPSFQGHPTGLGALVIKRSSAHYISPAASRAPTYFGGGSIDALSTEAPFWVHPRAFSSSSHKNSKENVAPQNIHARHEHGTLPFLSIIALGHAMDAHNRTYGTHDNVSKHTAAVTAHAHRALDSLIHANGQPLVHRYQSHSFPPSDGSPDMKESVHGPIISFTLYTPSAKAIGHKHLENLATIAGFQIRTGGLCNTGVLARVAGLSDWELEELYVAGRVCGDGRECDLSLFFLSVLTYHPIHRGIWRGERGQTTWRCTDIIWGIIHYGRCRRVRQLSAKVLPRIPRSCCTLSTFPIVLPYSRE